MLKEEEVGRRIRRVTIVRARESSRRGEYNCLSESERKRWGGRNEEKVVGEKRKQ